jgi:hypothetical protein
MNPFKTNFFDYKSLIEAAHPDVREYVQLCIEQKPFPLSVLVCRDRNRNRVSCADYMSVSDLEASLTRNGCDIDIHSQNKTTWLLEGPEATRLSFQPPLASYIPIFVYISAADGKPLTQGFAACLIETLSGMTTLKPYAFMCTQEILMIVFVDKHSTTECISKFFGTSNVNQTVFAQGERHYIMDIDWDSTTSMARTSVITVMRSGTAYQKRAVSLDMDNEVRIGPILVDQLRALGTPSGTFTALDSCRHYVSAPISAPAKAVVVESRATEPLVPKPFVAKPIAFGAPAAKPPAPKPVAAETIVAKPIAVEAPVATAKPPAEPSVFSSSRSLTTFIDDAKRVAAKALMCSSTHLLKCSPEKGAVVPSATRAQALSNLCITMASAAGADIASPETDAAHTRVFQLIDAFQPPVSEHELALMMAAVPLLPAIPILAHTHGYEYATYSAIMMTMHAMFRPTVPTVPFWQATPMLAAPAPVKAAAPVQAAAAPLEQFLCPIMQEVMVDPVVAEDGHTYERAAIECWFSKSLTSPMTSAAIKSTELKPNHLVRSMILNWKK